MACRDPSVAAEELGRGRKGPESIEVEVSVPGESLNDIVDLVERPLECDRPEPQSRGQRVDHCWRLVDAVRFTDDEDSAGLDDTACSTDGCCLQADATEVVRINRPLELDCRARDHSEQARARR